MNYKCMVCGNISSAMPDKCPKCDTANSYLPSQSSDSTPSGITKEEWDNKVNKPSK